MTRVVIKDGRIVTAVDDYVADILIEDGRIRTIGLELPTDDAEVHRADGPLVLPGGVDVHTHLDYDTGAAHTADDFSTGTRAAAFGGTTTLLDFAHQARGRSALAAHDDWRGRVETACIDVGAHMILTDAGPGTLAEMDKLVGRFPRKGTIAVGSDADLVIFDPAARWTVRTGDHHSRVDYSLFEGFEVTGKVRKVFSRGRLVVDRSSWLGAAGWGRYVRRSASGVRDGGAGALSHRPPPGPPPDPSPGPPPDPSPGPSPARRTAGDRGS